MAANPTPSVIPMKNFPSRVNFSRRGGRDRLAMIFHPARQARRRGSRAANAAPSEGDRNARDNFAYGGLRFVARGHEAVGVGREPYAMGENGDGEIVHVVGNAVVAAA